MARIHIPQRVLPIGNPSSFGRNILPDIRPFHQGLYYKDSGKLIRSTPYLLWGLVSRICIVDPLTLEHLRASFQPRLTFHTLHRATLLQNGEKKVKENFSSRKFFFYFYRKIFNTSFKSTFVMLLPTIKWAHNKKIFFFMLRLIFFQQVRTPDWTQTSFFFLLSTEPCFWIHLTADFFMMIFLWWWNS